MNSSRQVTFLFLASAIIALMVGIFFGVIGGFQYILPLFLKESMGFTKARPLHVTLVVTWIFSAAIGGIYYYLPKIFGKLYSIRLAYLHFILFVITGCAILFCFFTNQFGGKEYLEFPPYLAFPMLLTWVLFMVNFFMTIKGKFLQAPIYIWMWTTGISFFFFTLLETYLWTIPFFRDNIVRDVTVQWKSMGSLVGSWNMLVYGTAFYIMEKISGNEIHTRSNKVFFFYFLGLTNLMFNWGHHIYIVPSAPWIGNIAYIISMTELLILGNIIYTWKKSVNESRQHIHLLPIRFLSSSDVWVFLNLTLAILISIPAVNAYTHGTHITVAHAMGTTIGINTMILLASLFFIIQQENISMSASHSFIIKKGFWVVNISLLVFWISLIACGIIKASEQQKGTIFQQMMEMLSPWFHSFLIAGIGVFIGLLMICYPLFINFINNRIPKTVSES